MKISIVGWYGTETMGDISILDGILSVFSAFDMKSTVYVGSLYPFYSERTLLTQREIFNETAPKIDIDIFDIKDKHIRKEKLFESDIVIMGGGPLMDLEELYIIKDCFEYSKKWNIPTVIMGCGMGPLNKQEYIDVVGDIFKASSLISFRDEYSIVYARKLFNDKYKYTCLGDPAIISIQEYKHEINTSNKANSIAINFRDYPKAEYGGKNMVTNVDLRDLVLRCSEVYDEVKLVPMHTFEIGGDDRYFMTKLLYKITNPKIKILHKPLNLHELYNVYMKSAACIGMRYHSIVMQTILNGNNIILDYTDPINGKIRGFIDSLEHSNFYSNRYFQLRREETVFDIEEIITLAKENRRYSYSDINMKADYVNFLNQII